MKQICIFALILVSGACLWVIQERSIDGLESTLERQAQKASGVGQDVAPTRLRNDPRPLRSSVRPGPRGRVAYPERRSHDPANADSGAPSPVVSHIANELAVLMQLGDDQRERVLPRLERHVATQRKAAASLLNSEVYYYADRSEWKGVFSSAFEAHKGFHAAARELNALSLDGFEELLEPAARNTLHSQAQTHRDNTMMSLADSDYMEWRGRLGFDGIEQETYDVFYDLAEFRLNNPLPEGFSREDLAMRIREERRFLEESLSPLIGEEKAQIMRMALDANGPKPDASVESP